MNAEIEKMLKEALDMKAFKCAHCFSPDIKLGRVFEDEEFLDYIINCLKCGKDSDIHMRERWNEETEEFDTDMFIIKHKEE